MTAMAVDTSRRDIRRELGLRPIINASGTMTVLGASIMVPQAVAAMAAIATEFVEIDHLHAAASDVIARLTGAEAGFVTACCASAITLSVAGSMTGERLLAIERLPATTGLCNEVLVQLGHMVGYGASLEQTICMSGARIVPIGTVSKAQAYQLDEAITDKTACAVYVVSHMTVQFALLGLEEFCRVCHAKNIPVIVDAASEYDLRGFLARGADLVCYSGQKFLGGPTSGIVAGRRDLVRAASLQNRGIGRVHEGRKGKYCRADGRAAGLGNTRRCRGTCARRCSSVPVAGHPCAVYRAGLRPRCRPDWQPVATPARTGVARERQQRARPGRCIGRTRSTRDGARLPDRPRPHRPRRVQFASGGGTGGGTTTCGVSTNMGGEKHILVRVSRMCLNKSVLQTFLWVGSTLSRMVGNGEVRWTA